MDQETLIASVVREVLDRLGTAQAGASGGAMGGASAGTPAPVASPLGGPGLFAEVDSAVKAAQRAQEQLMAAGVAVRDAATRLIKKLALDNAQAWGRIELEETRLGRLDHKIMKLELIQKVPGVEFLRTVAHSGDEGIGLDELAPWGVIGVITPVTHSIPTLCANAINMIAAGNTLVVNAHPSGARCLATAVAAINQAIADRFKIGPLICAVHPPTLRTAEQIFQHPDVPLLVATGGPAVARAALKQSKRAIVAGPGNPPVVVDETADLDNAARSIILGASFDNNLLCIGEKEVFVVESVFGPMMDALRRAGAMELNEQQINQLTAAAFKLEKDHHVLAKELIGKDTAVLGRAAGVQVPEGVDLLVGRTDESNPFVSQEQMMPFVPLVPVRNFEQGLELAIKHEHGFGHTAIIHSNNLERITRMGRAVNTTIFVANGPCTAGLGIGGEGYPSYSIATPTGEGVTNPLTFTRFRRFCVSNALRIV